MVVLVIKAMIMENRQKRSRFGPNFKVPKHRNVNFRTTLPVVPCQNWFPML